MTKTDESADEVKYKTMKHAHAFAAEVAERLAEPFDASEVKSKPQTVSGDRALMICYVDVRVVQDRLDEVLGVLNWSDTYEVLPDGAVVCALRVRLGEEWVTKTDVGGMSEQPDEGDRRKAAFSDALKRAAVKFGVGRYLYRLKPQWVDWDARRRQPKAAPAAPAQHVAARAPHFHESLMQYDAELSGSGVCRPGELIHAVEAMGRARGFPADLAVWNDGHVKAARETTLGFVRSRKPAPLAAASR